MIDGLNPYAEMKESGASWLGSVPKHWQVLPHRALFKEISDRDHPEADMLSVTIAKGVIRQKSLLEDSSKKDSSKVDKSAYKLVQPGDIAYNKMRAWQGAVGVSDFRGIVSPAYVVQRPNPHASPRYLHYLLRTPAFAKEAERWSYGITSDMWSLRPEHFRQIYSCLPPPDEQIAIVRFLDHADWRIRRAIAAKQKLIRLLQEQKWAIIHCAVTRGLDPGVRLKPSGFEWLGDVPAHWEVMSLARVIADGPRNGISPSAGEGGSVESFSISAVRDGLVDVRAADLKYVSGNMEVLGSVYRLLGGDVLVVRGNGNIRLVGKAGLVAQDMPGRIYPDLLMRIRLTPRCIPKFLISLLGSPAGRDQIEASAKTAVGTFKVNNQQVRQLCFAFPPPSEQEAIVGWLDVKLHSLRTAASQVDVELSLLREFRARLITDVVTGKVDVQEATARLPELADLDADDIEADEEGEDESMEEVAAEDQAA